MSATATLTAAESLKRVQASAERIDRSKPQRFPEAGSPGDTFRQGDLYLTLLEKVPEGAVPVRLPAGQLAPGTTQGSRHCLDSLRGVRVYELASPTPLDGPILDLAEERTVEHPEHGHVQLPPGVYGVTYQRQFAEELRRVQD